MSKINYTIKELTWDTEYFGVSSARVDLWSVLSTLEQDELLGLIKDYDFTTIVNHNNTSENNYWIGLKSKAFLADVNVQFEKTVITSKKEELKDDVTVSNNLVYNQVIVDIAKNSFNYSRFFNDPKLDFEKKKAIYSEWVTSSFNQENKYFVISKENANIRGFILFSLSDGRCTIELISVEKRYQGQRIGKSMISALESFVIDKGIDIIKVGTQMNNYSALNFYISMQFKFVSCGSIHHLWNDCEVD